MGAVDGAEYLFVVDDVLSVIESCLSIDKPPFIFIGGGGTRPNTFFSLLLPLDESVGGFILLVLFVGLFKSFKDGWGGGGGPPTDLLIADF